MRRTLTLLLTLILALAFPPNARALHFSTVGHPTAVGAVVGSLGELGAGDGKDGFVKTAENRVATMQTSNELMNSSEEWRLLLSNQELNAEQRQQLGKDIQATAAQYGLTAEQFIFYLSESLKPGMFNPGDPAKGVPGSTVGVNLVGNDREHIITGVEALERIFHEYGHASSGPGKESDATALGSFASWYGKNILSFLYGVDMTGQTQTVDSWVSGNTDASLLRNNALAWNMSGSGTTENREDYIDRHISEPEKIAAQLQRERLIYGNAVEKGLAKLDMLLDAGEITPDEYGRRAGELLIAYNANIHAWNARLRVVGGVASMIGGAFVAGGGSVGSGGTGAVASIAVGGGMWVYGFDEIKTGAIELFTGKPALSSHEQIVMGLTGLSAEDAKTAVHAYGTLINLAGVVQAPREVGAGMLDVASTRAEAQLVLDKIAAAKGRTTIGVDSSMFAADEVAGVLVNGRYIKNPTAQSINELVTNFGQIGGKQMNGRFMYVIDQQGVVTIGSRGGQRMPHPTLIGGENPRVISAGIVDIRAGKIYSVDNVSGHFKPARNALEAAQKVFEQLPSKVFHKDFKGYLPYGQ